MPVYCILRLPSPNLSKESPTLPYTKYYSMSGSHALVVGASGLIGWAVVDQLLRSYPAPHAFSKVTALVNRPLKLEDSFWPVEGRGNGGPELALVPGVNLTRDDEEVERVLKEVKDVDSVRYVFYFGMQRSLAGS
jgi:nucleoside-diphosphate-sugar epimerase